MAKPNTNALEGSACPSCGQDDQLEVTALVTAVVVDDGVIDYAGPEWEDGAHTRCPLCGHTGTWGEFRPPSPPAAATTS